MITLKQKRFGEKAEEELLKKMRGAVSTATSIATEYNPAKLDQTKFNPDKLANVGKNMSEMAAKASEDAQEKSAAEFKASQEREAAKASDLASKAGGLNKNANADDDDDPGLLKILRMILKIVPIGTTIVKKTRNLAEGFAQSALGITQLIKNLAVSTVVFGFDVLRFAFEFAYYMFKMMLCSVGGALNLHKCILFYLIDLILFIFLLIITSILFLVDMFLPIKLFIGISCVEMLIFGFDLLEQFDQFVFGLFEVHVFHYPEFILNMCYRCRAAGDVSGFSSASRRIFKDIFVMIPNNIGSPIGNIIRGIGRIFGFFKF